jgi:F0F1-type ATP synthase assembly protein I
MPSPRDIHAAGSYTLMPDDYRPPTNLSQQHVLSSAASRTFRICSILVGVFVGFLVQEATLAANVVILEAWGHQFANTSREEIILFSCLWSFVTSAFAIILLGLLRAMMTSFFRAMPADSKFLEQNETIHRTMMETLEITFVVGALIGVSLAWVITDVFLGMQTHIKFSIITLGLALLWCKIVVSCRPQQEGEGTEELNSQRDLVYDPERAQVLIV